MSEKNKEIKAKKLRNETVKLIFHEMGQQVRRDTAEPARWNRVEVASLVCGWW